MNLCTATTIVVGNEKGGSGKTTTAMHLIVSLANMGFRVGSIDLDLRQQSLSRYLRNRSRLAKEIGVTLPMPEHVPFRPLANDPFPLPRQSGGWRTSPTSSSSIAPVTTTFWCARRTHMPISW